MTTFDKVKPKKNRLPFIPPKRQVTRRAKFVQSNEEKITDSADDSLRSGLRATSTRGRRARSRRYGKVKFPRTSGNNLQSSCNRQVTKHKCFERDIYVAEDDQEYHIGDSVYIQSDSISSTYFIGNILDFRTTRKEELLVEVTIYIYFSCMLCDCFLMTIAGSSIIKLKAFKMGVQCRKCFFIGVLSKSKQMCLLTILVYKFITFAKDRLIACYF